MSEANKALVRRYYQQATGDLSAIDQVVGPAFVDHHFPPGLPPGPAGVRQFFQQIIGPAFTGLKIEPKLMLAEGDKVDCHFAFEARHTGEFAGFPPTGNLIRCPAISTFRIEGGKLAEAWEIYDSASFLDQLRAQPSTSQSANAAQFYDAAGNFNQVAAKDAYLHFLRQSGYPVNDNIAQKLFVSDFNLGRFTEVGLAAIVWWGDEKHNYSGLDAFLLPGQVIPEHWHVELPNVPAKMECWLIRHGEVYAYSEGERTQNIKAKVTRSDAPYITVNNERVLRVGDVAGISHPLEKHWMQAGPQGAIFTEFCTFHSGEAVKFTDPKIKF